MCAFFQADARRLGTELVPAPSFLIIGIPGDPATMILVDDDDRLPQVHNHVTRRCPEIPGTYLRRVGHAIFNNPITVSPPADGGVERPWTKDSK